MKRIIPFLVAAVVVLLLVNPASADRRHKGSCVIEGVVIGPDDKPVSRASISYQSSGGNKPHALRADASGHFRVTGLVSDNYDIRATSKGIFSEWEKNVTVRKGKPTSVTLRLEYAKKMPKSASKTKTPNLGSTY
jgi:hypothetical protein